MTSHSSSRSSGCGEAAWLLGAACEWLNVLVSRWRRQPGGPTAHSSSDEVTAGTGAGRTLVSHPGRGEGSWSRAPGSGPRHGTFQLRVPHATQDLCLFPSSKWVAQHLVPFLGTLAELGWWLPSRSVSLGGALAGGSRPRLP